ncbi:MAG: hypothetical protein V1661_01550 [bacterium]
MKIFKKIYQVFRDINHGKHVPVYILVASIIFGVVFGSGYFFISPKQSKAETMTIANNLDSDDLSGFVWQSKECIGYCTQGFLSKEGNPGGAIFNRASGKAGKNFGEWRKTISWEALGVPAGAKIVAVDGRFDVQMKAQTHLAQETATLRILDKDAGASILMQDANLEEFNMRQDAETAWLTMDMNGAKIVKPLYQSSDAAITIVLEESVQAGKNDSAQSEMRADNIILYISYVPAANSLSIGNFGAQKLKLPVGAPDKYIGGAFTLKRESGSTTINKIILSETGSVDAHKNLSNVKLFYKQEDVCSEFIPKDALLFNPSPASFDEAERATAAGAMTVDTRRTCLYARMDIGPGIAPDDVLEIEIKKPATDIGVSQGSVTPTVAVPLLGTTKFYIGLAVGSFGTEKNSIGAPAEGAFLGGAFIFTASSASSTIAKIILHETGTINAYKNISNLKLFYKQEDVCSQDIPADALVFNVVPASFNAKEQAVVNGKMAVGTGEICVYARMDIGPESKAGETIGLEISNVPADIIFSLNKFDTQGAVAIGGAATVSIALSPVAAPAESASSSPAAAPSGSVGADNSVATSTSGNNSSATPVSKPVISVGAVGSQTSEFSTIALGKNIGGAFTLKSEGGDVNISQIIISEKGAINAAQGLSNLKLFYKEETLCSNNIPADAKPFNGSAGNFNGNEQVKIDGKAVLGAENTCFYLMMDINSGATADEALEIEITNPASDITATPAAVFPSSTVALSGATIIKAPAIILQSEGTQVGDLPASSPGAYIGGAFSFVRDKGEADVLEINLAEKGVINANKNLFNVKLFYKQESVCSSSIPSGAVLFNSGSAVFDANERAKATGKMAIGTNKVCVYIRADVGAGASDGETLDLEIFNPSADVVLSAGKIAASSPVVIAGTTTIKSQTTIGAAGSQIASLPAGAVNKYIGGAFTFVRASGSAGVTKIIVSETGTIDAKNNLSNLKIFYKQESVCSSSIPADAVLFNFSPAAFDENERAEVSGEMAVGATPVCAYLQTDIGADAKSGEKIDFEIANPVSDIFVSSGVVAAGSAIAIPGTTTLQTPSLFTAGEGNQTAAASASSTSVYLGGAFTFVRDSGTTDVLSISFSEKGMINARRDLSNLKVFYKQEAVCSANIPQDAAVFNNTGADFNGSERATATGTMPVGTKKVCAYLALDIGPQAAIGETIEIEISDPPVEILTSSDRVLPQSAVSLSGTTAIGGFNFESFGMPFVYNAAYWYNAKLYLEVYMRATAGAVSARLFDETDDAPVEGSSFTTASQSFTRLMTGSPLSLVSGHSYRVQFGKMESDGGEALGAKLVAR